MKSWVLGVLAISVALPLAAQLDPLAETVEVRVVNVDVVATDNEGRPIRGLTREDFELKVNGEVTEIEYFAAIRGDDPVDESAPAVAAGQGSEQSLPLLIIDYDARFSRPGEARRALEGLRAQLPALIESTRAIMIARQGMSLVIEQPFTRSEELLDGALEALIEKNVPNVSSADRRLLISQLERATNPADVGVTEEDQGVQDIALGHLAEVRILSQFERTMQSNTVAQLGSLISSVSGLPGRKAILYLGPGIQPQPAEAVYRLWWSKYESIANSLGITSIESEMGLDIAAARLTELLDKANEAQVAFYGFDPRGVRTGASAEFETLEATVHIENDARAQQEWVLSLARSTGGVGRINTTEIAGLVGEMVGGFRSYYSLGFSPGEEFPDKGKVRVELTKIKGRVRHFDRFVTRVGNRGLEELTLATLLTELAVNPMEIQVEMDAAQKQGDGTYLVPLLVKIPIASLTLVPKGTQHVGRLSVVVQAQAAGGEISPPAQGLVPIELDNKSLLSSLGGMAGYRLKMRVAKGEQKIAIGVRDEVAQRDSSLRLVIQAGRDS